MDKEKTKKVKETLKDEESEKEILEKIEKEMTWGENPKKMKIKIEIEIEKARGKK